MSLELTYLKEQTVKRLNSLPALSKVSVLMEDNLDLEAEINKALEQTGGLVVVVSYGDCEGIDSAIKPPLANVELVVEIGETPILNRSDGGSNIVGSDLATMVAKALHQYRWTDEGGTLIFKNIKLKVAGTSVIHQVRFKTRVLLDANLGVNE